MKKFLKSILLICVSTSLASTSFGMEEMKKPNSLFNFPSITINDEDGTKSEKYELTDDVFVEVEKDLMGITITEFYNNRFCVHRGEEDNTCTFYQYVSSCSVPEKDREKMIQKKLYVFPLTEYFVKENINFLINQIKGENPAEAKMVYAKIFDSCTSYLNPDEMFKSWQNINFYKKICFFLWEKRERKELRKLKKLNDLLKQRARREKKAKEELGQMFAEENKN